MDTATGPIDPDAAWAAVKRRDRSFDGRFVTGVLTTGIYCRPSCAARHPERRNVRFFVNGAAARKEGLRACKRCLPDDVSRDEKAVLAAIRTIKNAEDRISLDMLAERTGYSPTHFQRVFKRATGLSPAAYARAIREERARDSLAAADRVSDAIYDAGYEAPSRFYEDMKDNGADAETMDKNVTAVVEREMNGVPNFLYMSSTSRANGTGEIVVTFTSGTDLDVARTQVQDRLNRAEPRLPEDVRRLGIQIADNASGFLEVIVLKSRTGATSPLDLGDFASTKVVNELRRVPGVGNVSLFSSEKAMRVWLDPEKLAGYSLSASDALAAVQEQNSQTAGGGLAEQPLAPGSSFNARIVTQNRFTTAEQFRDIIVRANPDGSTVRLGDVARVELAADNYNFKSTLDGKEVAGLAVQLSSGSNAIATKNALSARMTELERSFPKDITWAVSYDTTPFIQASIDNVIQTLVEAMLLVFLVMFLFLQSWRATVIPALVVPIALLGGCLGLWAFGFSINQLSLFAMVVAIGILVDDAIVVVENVERIMAEEGLSPARATIKAMGQIRGAIIGITAVLIAVFLPMAFFPGSTGGIYRQFSVTLAVSIFFSALLALTLTPALCATLLKPHTHKPGHTPEPRSGWRGWPQRFFNGFNDRFTRSTDRYAGGVAAMLSRPLRWLAVFVAVVGVTWLLFARLPGGFLPEEDQGYFVINYDAPPAATMAQTEAAVKAVETEFAKLPQSQEIFSVIGFNFFGQGQTAGLSWAMLKPFDERKGKDLSVDSAIGAVFGAAANVP